MSYTDKMQDAAKNFAKSVNPDFVRALGGGGTDILFATLIPTTKALDKTFQELASAEVAYVTMEQVTPSGTSRANMPVIYTIADQTNNEYYVVGLGATKVSEDDNVSFEPMLYAFKATSADGYPTFAV